MNVLRLNLDYLRRLLERLSIRGAAPALRGGAAIAAALLCTLLPAVRAGAVAPPGRYVVSNGTVYDTKTKLTWEQSASSSTFTQAQAASYCAALALPGSGWRVPKISELLSIVDSAETLPATDDTVFLNTGNVSYQTSSAFVGDAVGYIWYVRFGTGNSDFNTAGTARVRCVR